MGLDVAGLLEMSARFISMAAEAEGLAAGDLRMLGTLTRHLAEGHKPKIICWPLSYKGPMVIRLDGGQQITLTTVSEHG